MELAGTGSVINSGSYAILSVGSNNDSNISAYTVFAAAAGVNAAGLNSFGGAIRGAITLAKIGGGTQILSGTNNDYTGGTVITSGTLQLGANNALPTGTTLNITGNTFVNGVLATGTLDLGGYSQTVNQLDSSTGGAVTSNPTLSYNSATSSWTASASVSNFTVGSGNFNGVISDGYTVTPSSTTASANGYVGTINLVKDGTGTLALTGKNTYSGTTTINNGILKLDGTSLTDYTNRLPATTELTLGNGATSGVLQLGGSFAVEQTITKLATSGSGTGNRIVGGNSLNSTLTVNQSATTSYSGSLGGAGTNENNFNFKLTGGGTLTLSGTNTYTGTTTVTGTSSIAKSTLILESSLLNSAVTVANGILIAADGVSLGQLLTVGSGGELTVGTSDTIGTITLSGGLALGGGTLNIQLATSGSTNIADLLTIIGNLNVTTASSITLSVAGSTLSAGTYTIGTYTGTASGTDLLSLTNEVVGANSLAAKLTVDTATSTLYIVLSNTRLWLGQTNSVWDIQTTSNWNSSTGYYYDGDEVVFNDSATGSTNVVLNTTVAPTTISFSNSTAVTYTLSGTGSITGTATLTKSGTGAVVISNANSYSGLTTIKAGSIEMQNALALGTGGVSVTGGTLLLSGGISVADTKTLALSGTGALRNKSGNNTYAGAVTLADTPIIGAISGTLTVSGVVSGDGSLTKDGAGTVVLSNTNTYTGKTYINEGTLSVSTIGSVAVAGGLGRPTSVPNGTINIGSGTTTGTLRWTGSGETTDRVIDLAGTTGGATIDASGTGALILSSAFTFSGSGSKTLTLTGTGGTASAPNTVSRGIDAPSTGTLSLVKSGSGVWRLNAVNNYTGSTTIKGGTLQLGVADALANSSSVILANAADYTATLDLKGYNQIFKAIEFGGETPSVSGTNSISLNGGTITLNGDVTYTSTNNPLGGEIKDGTTAGGSIDLVNTARTFAIGHSINSGGADLTVSAKIIASAEDAENQGALLKTGTGTLVLTGANTYTGATTVDQGVLRVNAQALANTSIINVATGSNDATLDFYANTTPGTATLSATDINIGSSTAAGYLGFKLVSSSIYDSISTSANVAVGSNGAYINGIVSGTGTYDVLATSGTISSYDRFDLGRLTGGYSYQLITTANLVQLVVSDLSGEAATGPYYWTGNNLDSSWASLKTTSGSVTSTNWSNSSGTDLLATPGYVDVYFDSSRVSGSVSSSLNQAYSIRGLYINTTSAVQIGSGTNDGVLTIGTNGINVLTGKAGSATTIDAPVVLGASQAWTVADSDQTLTVNGAISGSGMALTKAGSGTLVLTGVNSYTGATTINAGTVKISNAASLGSPTTTATVTINAATLQATADITSARNYVLGNSASVISVDSSKTFGIVNTSLTNVTGSGVLNAAGAGTLVLNDTLKSNDYSGGTVISGGGKVKIYTTSSLGSGAATINDGTLNVAADITGARTYTLGNTTSAISVDSGVTFSLVNSSSVSIGGTGALNAIGAGILVLNDTDNANTYQGGTVVSGGGTVKIYTSTSLGSGSLTLTSGTLAAAADITEARNYTLGSAAAISVNAGKTLSIVNTSSTNITGTGLLYATGAGTLELNDAAKSNDYSGGTVISGGGTVRVYTGTSLGSSSSSLTINSGTLAVANTAAVSRNFFLGSSASTISVASGVTYTIDGLVADGSQAGTLNVSGSGTVILTGSNTYTGGTEVSSGTLRVTNTSGSGTGSGNVSVNGGMLSGNGVVSGTVSVGSGATISPYDSSTSSTDTLTVGNLTLHSGSTLSYQLGGTATSDLIMVSGTLTASGGTFTLDTSTVSGFTAGNYHLVKYGSIGGTSFDNLSVATTTAHSDSSGNKYYVSLSNDTTNGYVDLVSTNTLTWTGAHSTIWQNGGTGNNNWKTDSTTNLNYYDTMNVVLDDTWTSSDRTVTISGAVAPASITVSGDRGYILTGSSFTATTLTKSGSGELVLTMGNSVTDVTTINAGGIELRNGAALGNSGSIVVGSGGALRLTGAITVDGKTLSIAGNGTNAYGALQNISGANTFSGDITLTAASKIGIEDGSLTLSGGVAGDTFAVSLFTESSGTLNISGIISGSGAISKTGAGIVNLSGTNTYTGAVTVSAGILNVSNPSGLGTTAAATTVSSGATLQLQGGIAVGAEALTLSGSGASALDATGALESVSGANTYAGLITLAAASTVSVDASTFGVTNTGTITGAFGLTLNAGSGATGTLASIIGTTTGTLTKTGAGTWILTGTSTYTGATTIAAGTLVVGATNALGTSTVVTLGSNADTNGTLNLGNGASSFSQTIAGLATAGAGIQTITNTSTGAGTAILTIAGTSDYTFAGILTDGSTAKLGLTKTGTNKLTLTGTGNSYDGATTVSAGILNIQSNTALGTTAGNTTVATGATLQLQGGIAVGAEALTLGGTGASGTTGALQSVSGANAYGGLLTLSAATTISVDADTLDLTNTGTITGATFGLTLIGSGTGSIASIIGTTSGTLTKQGSGTWILTGTNTFTGAVSVEAGILNIRNASALGTTASGTTVTSGATLQLQGGITVGSEALTIGGSGIIGTTTGALESVSGANKYGGLLTLSAATTISVITDTLELTNTGSIVGGGFGLTLAGAAGTGSIASILDSSIAAVTKDGAGTWILSGANTYDGATLVSGGILNIQNGSALGSTAAGTTVSSGATLQLQGGIIVAAEALSIAGNGISGTTTGALQNVSGNNEFGGLITLTEAATIASDSGTLTLSNTAAFNASGYALTLTGAGNGLLAGSIAGGSLTKSGTGTWALTGVSTYTGATTITAGTLIIGVANALNASAIVTLGSSTDNTSGTLDLGYGATSNNLTVSGLATAGSGTQTITNTSTGTDTATLTIADTVDSTFAGILTDGSTAKLALTKTGSHTLTLAGSNSYDGATLISGGILNIQNGSALGTTAEGTTIAGGTTLQLQGGITVGAEALTLSGSGISGTTNGALENVSGNNQFGGQLTLAGATTIASNLGTLTLSNSGAITGDYLLTLTGSGNGVLAGALGGSASLAKTGTGTWTVSGAGSYSGATTVSEGTLVLSGANTYSGGTAVTGTSSIPATLVVTGGSKAAVTSGTGLGDVTINTYGVVAGSGRIGGSLNITGGTFDQSALSASTTSTLYVGSNLVLDGASLKFRINGAGDGDYDAIEVAGQLNFGLYGTQAQSKIYLTIAKGIASGSSMQLVLAGSNGGDFSNIVVVGDTTTGQTDIAVGTYKVTLRNTAGLNILVAELSRELFWKNYTSDSTWNTSSENWLANSTQVAYANPDNVVFNDSVTAGTISIAEAVSPATITVNNASGNDYTFLNTTGKISGTGSLTKTGTGTLTLSVTGGGSYNDYTGATTLSGGTLSVDLLADAETASSIGKSTGLNPATNLVFDGGTLQYTGSTASTNRNFSITNAKTAVIEVAQASTTLTLSGASAASSGGLTKTGNGTLVLSGANLYTGLTTVSAGELDLNTTGSNAISGNLTVSGGVAKLLQANQLGDTASVSISGGTLDLQGFAETVGALSISGGTLAGSGTLTALTYGLTNGTINANLGGGTITVNSGTTTLNGTAGATIVDINGTLALGANDRLANTATVNVASGGVLDTTSSGYTNTVGTLNVTSGSVNGTGTITAGTYGLTGATINANLGTGTITVNSGTTTLNGTAGATIVDINGTLALGASDRLGQYRHGECCFWRRIGHHFQRLHEYGWHVERDQW